MMFIQRRYLHCSGLRLHKNRDSTNEISIISANVEIIDTYKDNFRKSIKIIDSEIFIKQRSVGVRKK